MRIGDTVRIKNRESNYRQKIGKVTAIGAVNILVWFKDLDREIWFMKTEVEEL